MTPPETMPGSDSASTRFTSGVILGQRGTRGIPALRQATASSMYCAMPAAKRPQAKI